MLIALHETGCTNGMVATSGPVDNASSAQSPDGASSAQSVDGDASSAQSADDAANVQSVDDAATAPCPADGGAHFTGTLSGANVNVTLCNLNVLEPITREPAGNPDGVYNLYVGAPLDVSSNKVTAPAGVIGFSFGVNAQVSPAVGVYSSDAGCGELHAIFDLPPLPGVSCSGNGPTCAAGCVSQSGGDGGAGPCAPATRQVWYVAQGTTTCYPLGEPQSALGSWKVTLRSVAAVEAEAGTFVGHGTMTGTLLDQDSGAAATLALTF